jgi:hypothetical protein
MTYIINLVLWKSNILLIINILIKNILIVFNWVLLLFFVKINYFFFNNHSWYLINKFGINLIVLWSEFSIFISESKILPVIFIFNLILLILIIMLNLVFAIWLELLHYLSQLINTPLINIEYILPFIVLILILQELWELFLVISFVYYFLY